MSCQHCIDEVGAYYYPHYGVGPHICFHHIPGRSLGQSEVLPKDQWPSNYLEDPECPGCGVWWCPYCEAGKPTVRSMK